MIVSHVSYNLDMSDLARLKVAASVLLPELSPTWRLEVMARAAGSLTYASLRAKLKTPCAVVLDPAIPVRAFLEDRAVSIDPLKIHLAFAHSAVLRMLEDHPHLHHHGYGTEYFINGHGARSSMAASRTELAGTVAAGEFLRAHAFLQKIKKIDTVNRSRSSYGLKHVVEKIAFDLGGQILPANYITNGALIAAALYNGFDLHRIDHGPNAHFNMSKRSIEALISEHKASASSDPRRMDLELVVDWHPSGRRTLKKREAGTTRYSDVKTEPLFGNLDDKTFYEALSKFETMKIALGYYVTLRDHSPQSSAA